MADFNVLLLGHGAREHVIAETLKRSRHDVKLFAYMRSNNPGISECADGYILGEYDDVDQIKTYSTLNKIDFAFIGPENPLELGIVDALLEVGVKSVGPKQKLAFLETSKSFTRELLTKYNIPGNAKFKVFATQNGVNDFIHELDEQYVVKADGLMGGKGVKVSGEHLNTVNDGIKYCKDCIVQNGKVIVEEKFVGQEFSLMCFCDGKTVKAMPVVQDHKRAFVNDEGPNTGGMGSYSGADHLLPFLTQKDVDDALAINQQVCDALKEEVGEEYKGIMYGGFIAVKDGVRLIEYNARFGDPEVMNVLPLLQTDFIDICVAIIEGTLDDLEIKFDNKATVCKYVVPDGYPDNPVDSEKIAVDEVKLKKLGTKYYYASVDKRDDGLYMTISRAIALVGVADDIYSAEEIAEESVKCVTGLVQHRPDIGTEKLVSKRIKHMKELRG
jgi:phosphoribosylamine---glycine ligase